MSRSKHIIILILHQHFSILDVTGLGSNTSYNSIIQFLIIIYFTGVLLIYIIYVTYRSNIPVNKQAYFLKAAYASAFSRGYPEE